MLLLVLLHLLLASFGTQLQVVRVVHLVVVDAPHGHLDGACGDVVHKLAVVADYHHRLAVVDKEVLEPADRLDVEVVGRFVEQQHVGVLQQHLGQFDAHAPAARKFACLPVEVSALKTQAEQCLFHVLLKVRHVNGIELFAQRGHLLNQCHVVLALIVGAFGQLAVKVVKVSLHFVQVGKGLACLFKHGASVLGHEVLRQVGYHSVFWGRHRTTCGFAHTGQNLEQGAFACTIFAHQGYAVVVVDNE